jgi:hypothetical protein
MNFSINYLKYNKEIYDILIEVIDSYNLNYDFKEFNISSEYI